MIRESDLTIEQSRIFQEKINEIKVIYEDISHGKKRETIAKIAEELRRKPSTLKNHWFKGFWAIPYEHVDDVLTFFKTNKND